jgi:hypothetical protein
MIEWLAAVDPRLPATMIYALGSNYVVRLYDHSDAAEYFGMRMDGMDEEDTANLELPDVTIPASCELAPLNAYSIGQRRRRWPADVCAAVDAALELNRLSAAFRRIRPRHQALGYDLFEGMPLPAMIVAFADHDHVHAAFDDEAQYMGAEGNEPPNVFWMIQRMKVRDVRAAFDGLGKAIEIVAATVRLLDTFPDSRRDVIPPERRSGQRSRRGLPLVRVLAHGGADYHDIDDEEAA